MTPLPERDDLPDRVHAALRAWHETGGTAHDLLEDFLLVRQRRADLSADGSPVPLRQATNQVLQEILQELERQDPRGAEVIRQRFREKKTLYQVANDLDVSDYTVSRVQRAAIEAAAEILARCEQEARRSRAHSIEAFLPPPTYTCLFGVEEAQDALLTRLLPQSDPGVVTIVGIGGIGKTALADALTRRLIRDLHYDDVLWLRVRPKAGNGRSLSGPLTYEALIDELADRLLAGDGVGSVEQRLARVREILKTRPHLVVVDNLEAEEDLNYLLARLVDLAGPGKFLLTSRFQPPEEATVYAFPLRELSPGDARKVMQHHARETGSEALSGAAGEDLDEIFEVTGGNPLALKLVAGLLDVVALPQLLQDLTRSRPGPIEELYRHIYWQSWQTLDEACRRLLKAMPLVGDTGATADYLQALSGLDPDDLWQAIYELRRRSLLEVRGSLHEKRYGIHRLTDSFLRTEIVHWPADEEAS